MRSATRYSHSVDSANTPPDLHACARRLVDPRIGVAENRRTVAHAVIDVDVVVEVSDPGAAAHLT